MIIETKIIEKPAFSVVGITESIHFDMSVPPSENAIAKLWGEFSKRIPEVSSQLGWRSYGLMLQNPDNPPGEPFNYTASVQISQDWRHSRGHDAYRSTVCALYRADESGSS